MPAEKPTMKSSENRRSNKPIMEKRRRARINSCLNDLKTLILEALKKDPARHSKLEKADILEMTVKHLQNLQRQQMALATATDPNVANKFRAGFSECANEVTRFLGGMDGLDTAVQQRLLGHLANCMSRISATSTYGYGSTSATAPMPILPAAIQPLSIHVPSNGINASMGPVPSTPHGSGKMNDATMVAPPHGRVVNGLHLVPTRLPNGDFALLLPTNYSLANHGGNPPSVAGNQCVTVTGDMVSTNVPNTTVPNTVLSPLTVSMSPVSSTAATPSPASSTRMSPMSVSPMQRPRIHYEKVVAPPHSVLHARAVKPELTTKDYCRENPANTVAPSQNVRRLSNRMMMPEVRSQVVCKEATNKEPWRPW